MSDILKKYRAMAAGGKVFRGLSVLQHEATIAELVRETGAESLLDWGCGAGEAYEPPHSLHERLGIKRLRLYDPAFVRHQIKPDGRFDGVVCSDVLEHVPRENVPKFVANLFKHADRFVFASVCCRPANKTFPSGENLHVTIEPREWWHDIFTEQARIRDNGVIWQLVETP